MSVDVPALSGRRATWGATVRAYIALTKPRIIELLLVTTLPTMVVAQRGVPPVWLMAATLAGGITATVAREGLRKRFGRWEIPRHARFQR